MEEDPFGMKEFRKNMLEMYPDLDLEELKVTEESIVSSMRAFQEMGQHHVLGSPLFDVLSITVRPKISPPPKGSWRIAGKIYLGPDSQRGTTDPKYIYIFQRKSDKSQYLDPSAPFLTLDLASPLVNFFPAFELCLELLAKRPRSSQTRPLLTNTLRLDYTNYPDDKFDTVQHHDVTTSDADLCVKYITYRAAVGANVIFSLNVPNGQQSRQVKVSGSIYASWDHSKEQFKPHLQHERHCPCVCLFNSCFSLVTTGQPFPLSRSSISVPSYGTLIIEVILSIEGVNCHHVLDLPPQDIDTTYMEFEVAGGLIGKFSLHWWSEVLLDKEEEEEETITEPGGKKAKLTMPQLPKSICIHDAVLDKELVGAQMTEIYSIYVGTNDKSSECRVNGTIDVRDGWRLHRIFEMNEGSLTRKFVHGTSLPLVGPHRCLEGNCFVQVRLRDDEGREFCKGYMGWDLSTLRPPWLDKWLCSIIKGQLGFTEIYYALYPSAVSCAVNVFLAAPSACENVYIRGSIVCQLDIEYTTTFQRKYYRSFLFHKEDDQEEGPMILEFGAKNMLVNIPSSRLMNAKHNKYWISMPLSRPAVSVPTDNILFIEVDLSLECDSDSTVSVEKLMGYMEFQIGRKTWRMISSDNYQMYVTVDWA